MNLKFFFAVLLLGSLAGCSFKKNVLYLYNWADYIPQEILEKFEKETGITVVCDVYESEEVAETNLYMSSNHDVVILTVFPSFARAVKSKLLSPIDYSLIPNAKGLDKKWTEKLEDIDPENRYGVIYLFGSVGLGVNVKAVKKTLGTVPRTWGLIFDPLYAKKLTEQRIYCLDTAKDVFQAALLYMGKDPCSENFSDWTQAYELVRKVRPFIARFENGSQEANLLDEQACLIQAHSDLAITAKERGQEMTPKKDVDFVIPKEGVIMTGDLMTIPLRAQHKRNAHIFINFILRPENMAFISNRLKSPNAVTASLPLLDPELRENPSIFPNEQTMPLMKQDFLPSLPLLRHIYELWLKLKQEC
jgi:putrescine transport system substrate-binding protein